MPFINTKKELPKREFNSIDEIILTKVFPELIWLEYGSQAKIIPILPNGIPTLFTDEAGSIKEKNSRKYFALSCLVRGLSYSEIGLWLDICLEKYVVQHSDGKTRYVGAENESSLRFDHRKPIYQYNGTHRRYLVIRE